MAQHKRNSAQFSDENRLETGHIRGEVGFVVNVVYANEPDPEAEADIDRLLASLLRIKSCE